MSCPECGLPPECQECKGMEREVERLERKVADLREELREAHSETEDAVKEAREELTKEHEAEAKLAIGLMTDLLALVDGLLAGTERHADLEAPRLRRRVEQWTDDNTPVKPVKSS